ncbi:MAG: SLC13 family permease [Bacilli bacterium]
MFLSIIPSSAIMFVALALFLTTYVFLLLLPKYRAYVALIAALVFIVLGISPVGDLLNQIDFNVLMMIAGTMGIVALFIESKMPSLLADLILKHVPNVKWAIIYLSLFAGVVSAFVDNVATVIMIAPVAINIAKKLKISPVLSIIAIAISSNIQGAATLVGDTTSIMLAGSLDMSFNDFFWYHGKPGLFFIVMAGAAVSLVVLYFYFKKDTQKVVWEEKTEVTDYFPTFLLGGMILLLISASLLNIPAGFVKNHINGFIVMTLLFIGLIYKLIKTRNPKSLLETVKEIDYFTLLLLVGLFIIIGGLETAGVIEKISEIIVSVSKGNLFVTYTILVFASVLFSAFIDNIPYVLTMLPVIATLGTNFPGVEGTPYVLYFGLLVGATLGGNITPIGASANITGIGILRKEGYEVKASTFMKLSIPFTLAVVLCGYLLTWIIWA